MNKHTVLVVFISLVATAVFNFLLNLLATYAAPALQEMQWLIWIILAVFFYVIYQATLYLWPQPTGQGQHNGPSVTQRADGEGSIRNSPIDVAAASNAQVTQEAIKKGKISDSGINVS